MPINKERVCKWVSALDSGKFSQTFDKLKRNSDEFCALGLACHVYERQTRKKINYSKVGKEILPIVVRDWYGFDNRDPIIAVKSDGVEYVSNVSLFNDAHGVNFTEFAKAIKQTFKLSCVLNKNKNRS